MSDTVTNLKHGVLAFNGWHFDDAESRVDALVAAVRAEERARCVAVVEQHTTPSPRTAATMGANAVIQDILAAIGGANG